MTDSRDKPISPSRSDASIQHLREKYAELALAQHPQAILVGCADSRTGPTNLFDLNPGEAFVQRPVAAAIPPAGPEWENDSVIEAIGFAIRELGVGEVYVKGHASCGGINALWKSDINQPPKGRIAAIGHQACCAVHRDFTTTAAPGVQSTVLAQAVVLQSILNLTTHPFYHAGIKLFGLYFDLPNLCVLTYDEMKGDFVNSTGMSAFPSITNPAALDPRAFIARRAAALAASSET